MRKLFLGLVLVLVALSSFGLENMVGDPWTAGTSTIVRYLQPKDKYWNVSIAPDAQDVSVIFYSESGLGTAAILDTLTVRAGEIYDSPGPLLITRYDILRPTSTDGIDYATLAPQSGERQR